MNCLHITDPCLEIEKLESNITFDAQRLQDLLNDNTIPSIPKKTIQKFNKEKKNHNTYNVKYDYKADNKIGRVYSELHNIPSEYLTYLFGDGCIEIDFKNCHYVFIGQIGEKYGLNIDNINYYIKNREECLDAIHQDRKKAKELYLIAQYGGSVDGIKNDNIIEVANEIKRIIIMMNADESLKDIKIHAEKQYKKKNNPHKSIDHSFMSYVLQTIENRNILSLYEYLNNQDEEGLEIKKINHDGIVVKPNNFDYKKMKKDMQEVIFDETGFYSEIDFKPCEQKYVKPDYETIQQKEQKKNLEAFLEMKTEWEEEKGLCKITGLSCYSVNGLEGQPRNYFNETQLSVSYGDKCYDYIENGVLSRKPFLKKWYSYEDKKTYDAIDNYCVKSECPENILNVWVDFPVVSYLEKKGDGFIYDEEAVEIYKEHIYLMAGEEKETGDFLEKWIANFFQYPASKSLCPIIVGDQGTGKDLLVDIISAIIGNDRRLTTSKPEDEVWGKFNEIMENKMLIQLSEVNSYQTSAGINTLKDLITNPTFVIKRKGLKSSTIKSYHKYIALSNNAMPVKCGAGQRRFVNLLSSSKMKGNMSYFQKLVDIMKDMNKLASIYTYFMNKKDIPERLTEKDIVDSEYHKDIESIVVDDVKEYFKEYIYENKDGVCDGVRLTDLYPEYKKYCEKNYINNIKSFMSFSAKFGIMMRTPLFSKKITKGEKDRKGYSYNIAAKELAIELGYFA